MAARSDAQRAGKTAVPSALIQVTDLQKSYAARPALRGISFQVAKGQTLALLGPNGAGKSTAISILCTGMAPDGGLVRMAGLSVGRDDREIRKKIGVVFQNGLLDEALTVEENLLTRGRFYGLRGGRLQERVENTARMTGALELLHRPYGQLSGGQRRRCDIARALLHRPGILILDEPTTGLDPEMRRAVWDTIGAVKQKTAMTVLLSTHYMEEAAMADEIVVLKSGRIAASGRPDTLKERYAKDTLFLFSPEPGALCRLLYENGVGYGLCPGGVSVPLAQTRGALPLLELCRGRYTDFEVRRGTMDDAYHAIIQEGASHAHAVS